MSLNNIGQIYKCSSSWQESRWNELFSLFYKQNIDFNSLKNGIDLGCGTGQRTLDFVKKIPNIEIIHAIDSNRSMIETAKKCFSSNHIKYYLKKIEHLDNFNVNNLDFVFSNYSIHWIKNKFNIFESLKQKLSKKSYLIIGTVESLPDMLQTIDTYFRNNWLINEESPYYFLKKKEWEELLNYFGWEIMDEIKKEDKHIVKAGTNFLLEWYSASTGRAFYKKNLNIFKDKKIKELKKLLSILYGTTDKKHWKYNEQTYLFIASKK